MKTVVISENEWVYPDIYDYPSAKDRIEVHAPRGGYAAAQIQAAGTRPGDAIVLSYEGVLEFEGYRMLDVTVERNTSNGWPFTLEEGDPKPDHCTRQAPFQVFDILQPMDQGGDVVEKETTAFYVCWRTPRDAEPGVYEGRLTVRIGGEISEIPVQITVHSAALPQKSRLLMTNWYNLKNIGGYYGLEKFSAEWYGMLRKFFDLMARTRQTHIIIPLAIGIEESGGSYRFDFAEVEKLIKAAMEAGFQTPELGHICEKNYVKPEKYWLFYQPEGRKIYADSEEGYNFLAQFLPAWTAFLRKNGWYDAAVQHVGDEPTAEIEITDYRMICGMVRKFMPGMKLFDAVCHTGLAGSVDCWVLQNHEYQHNREKYEKYRALGDEIWQYTCCMPVGKWLNRLLDGELLKPRLLHYGNYLFDLAGYLHWGFNYYQGGMEHLRKSTCGLSSDKIHYWPAGDTNICYPGNENGPWMSVRAERMRAGAEDCELLWMISEKDKDQADALCKEAMSAFDEYETDVRAFEDHYIRLLEAADRLA